MKTVFPVSSFRNTKLWRDDVGYDSALQAIDASLEGLGLDGPG